MPTSVTAGELAEFGLAIQRAMPRLCAVIVDRFRSELPALGAASAAESSNVALADHTSTLLGEICVSLQANTGPDRDSKQVRSDGHEIHTLIGGLHGTQRANSGWTERALSREYEIMTEEGQDLGGSATALEEFKRMLGESRARSIETFKLNVS